MAVRDSDTLLWLHNKLGVDDSWGSGNISSLLNADVLRNVIARQEELEPQVLLKLLISFIDIRPDAMETMKSEISTVIGSCAEEDNPWLQLIAEIVRPFPGERRLETDVSDSSGFFGETLAAIKRELAEHETKPLLPLVSAYLNKTALEAIAGSEVQQPKKHFELRKKLKSEFLREELLRKSKLAADAAEMKKHSAGTHAFSGKARSVPLERQLSEPATVVKRTISSHSTSLTQRRTSTLATPSVPTKPSTIKRDPKIQLIDLSEAPMAGKKRRREREGESAAKRLDASARSLARQKLKDVDSNRSSLPPPTPHYAASLGGAGHSPPSSPQQPAASFVPSSVKTSVFTIPSYALTTSMPSGTSSEKPQTNVEAPAYVPQSVETAKAKDQPGVVLMTTKPPAGFGPVFTLTGGQTLAPGTKLVAIPNPQQPGMCATILQRLPATTVSQNPVATDVRPTTTAVPKVVISSQPKAQAAMLQPQTGASQPQGKEPVAAKPAQAEVAPQPAKKELRLTREQLTMAQEMFKNANKVTREDKAIILSFMAGSRENPYPNQGELVTVLLNQTEEHVKADGAEQRIIIEILFEMNYKTGQWRRLQRKRIMQLTSSATT